MAKFSVRVELRDSEEADYTELHKRMAAKKFTREIEVDTELDVREIQTLPTAEYNYESEKSSPEEVAGLAYSIAEKIKENPRIMVTKSAGRFFIGLDKEQQ